MLRMLILFFVVSFFTLSNAKSLSLETEWESFKEIHGKWYSDSEEEFYRKTIFAENLKLIEQHNEEAVQGKHTYHLGVTKFMDMAYNEIRSTGLINNQMPTRMKIMHSKTFKTEGKLPESVDWRTKGILTKVRDQGNCPVCWAFASVAAIESAYAQKTGKLVELSEQNIVDCLENPLGCEPNYIDKAYEFAQEKGIDLSECYPYISWQNTTKKFCKFNQTCSKVKISKFGLIPAHDEDALAAAVAKQVITVGIDDDMRDFYYYRGGIINSKNCRNYTISHAVALVGYGTENGTDYWIFKNSLGEDWGENGYGRLLRGVNMCGIVASESYFPII